MTPWKLASDPIGSWMTAGIASSRFSIISTVRKKLAPMRSILLTKHMRGHLVLVGLAPDGLGLRLDAGDRVEHGDRTVEHAQRALDLDREVDVAGVSMMLMRWSFQNAVVAADVMVMPRSCSWTMWSMTAAPSWTSPIL